MSNPRAKILVDDRPLSVGAGGLLRDRLTRYGIISAGKGAAIALGLKVLSDIKKESTYRDGKKYVSVPKVDARYEEEEEDKRKQAEIGSTSAIRDWFHRIPRGPAHLDLPVTVASIAIPGIGAYKAVSHFLDEREKKKLEREIEMVKSRHLDKITGTKGKKSDAPRDEVDKMSDAISKSVSDLPNIIDGGFEKMENAVSRPKKKSASVLGGVSRVADAAIGLGVLATVSAGLFTHMNRLQKERDLDELYLHENRKKFKKQNPDLLSPSIHLEGGSPRKSAASVLQNTLIALNIQEFANRSNQRRKDVIEATADRDSEIVSGDLEGDLLDLGIAPRSESEDPDGAYQA